MFEKITWDAADLAPVLHLNLGTLKRKVSSQPDTLPPGFKVGRRTLWLPATVQKWMEDKQAAVCLPAAAPQNLDIGDPSKRRPGRPRKICGGEA